MRMTMNIRRRPNRSLKRPPSVAPTMAPMTRNAPTEPCCAAVMLNCFCKSGIATAVMNMLYPSTSVQMAAIPHSHQCARPSRALSRANLRIFTAGVSATMGGGFGITTHSSCPYWVKEFGLVSSEVHRIGDG